MGHSVAEQTRRKISIARKNADYSYLIGTKRSEEVRQRISKNRKGIPVSKEWREKLRRAAKSGKDSVFWNGGITPLYRKIRYSLQAKLWKEEVFKRDNYTCQDCGIRGGDLEAHHIKEFSEIIKEKNIKTLEDAVACAELWDIMNGQTLCLACHRKTFKK